MHDKQRSGRALPGLAEHSQRTAALGGAGRKLIHLAARKVIHRASDFYPLAGASGKVLSSLAWREPAFFRIR